MQNFVSEINDLFRDDRWQPIGHLRTLTARILHETRVNRVLAEKMRVPDRTQVPWAKTWTEEFYPLYVLGEHLAFPNDAEFSWTPNGAADFRVRMENQQINIQSTLAFAERKESAGVHGGHVRHLEMKKLNEDGFSYRGGFVSTPRTRKATDEVEAWKIGISRAIEQKLRSEYAGCWLLVSTHECQFDTIDFRFKEDVVIPATDRIEKGSWEKIFDGLFILDQLPPAPFVQLPSGSR